MDNDFLSRARSWMGQVGNGLTPEQARQRIKQEFPAFLDSLHGSRTDHRQFLRQLLAPPPPEEKPELLRKLKALGHRLTLAQLDQVHEITFSFFDSLLQEIEEEIGSMPLNSSRPMG
jgi:hypothetical protein